MGELQKKEEEMRQMFVQRVKEKEAELKEAEKEVSSFHLDPNSSRKIMHRCMTNFCLRKFLVLCNPKHCLLWHHHTAA